MSQRTPEFEDQRLAALYDYEVLDSQPEEAFDRITRLVRITLGTPIAVVSLVDRNRQWFKSRVGTATVETPRDISFCTHTIQTDQPLIVQDASQDERFRNSPLVTGPDGIRFYAGMPLRTPEGFNIGALCAMDIKPRELSEDHLNILRDLARLVVNELELRKLAAVDGQTGAVTARTFALEAKKEVVRAQRYRRDLSFILLDLDHFKRVNDTYGHAAGDAVLHAVVEVCDRELRAADLIGRIGGEEFAIALPETSLTQALEIAERLRRKVAEEAIVFDGKKIKVTASFGVASCAMNASFAAALKQADAAMYRAKNAGRNRVSAQNLAPVQGTAA
jgi:diguanylate cyclase (GGDEF)-like protein